MKYPNLLEERKLWRKGIKWVAGLDEAGRGPLAGPVVAAAVVLNPGVKVQSSRQYQNSNIQRQKPLHLSRFWISNLEFRILLREVRDSKKLSPKKRKELYKALIKHPQIKWGIGRVSERVIDRINVREAAKLAMKRAVINLRKKFPNVDFLILDGRMKVDLEIPQKSIVKADNKVFSCAAASIIAKVVRDRIMERYEKRYPQYGFLKHKGYGTRFHLEMLKKYGPCKVHRRSFRPVKEC